MGKISRKIISYFPQIFTLLFIAGFAVYAWTEPSQAPPGGNVSAPLNAGPTGQSKEGGLILNTGGAANGLIVQQGTSTFNGNVCIGVACRNTWPSGTLNCTDIGQQKTDSNQYLTGDGLCATESRVCVSSRGWKAATYSWPAASCGDPMWAYDGIVARCCKITF